MSSSAGSCPYPREDGIVYSARAGWRPFSVPSVEEYVSVVGQEAIDRLLRIASQLKGMTLLELNSSAKGGGVAEMLFSSIPLLDQLGIDVEWMIITGSPEYFETTKTLHNLLQGMPGTLTTSMEQTYLRSIEASPGCGDATLISMKRPFAAIRGCGTS